MRRRSGEPIGDVSVGVANITLVVISMVTAITAVWILIGIGQMPEKSRRQPAAR